MRISGRNGSDSDSWKAAVAAQLRECSIADTHLLNLAEATFTFPIENAVWC